MDRGGGIPNLTLLYYSAVILDQAVVKAQLTDVPTTESMISHIFERVDADNREMICSLPLLPGLKPTLLSELDNLRSVEVANRITDL